jgi:hypothetical protein
VDSCGGGIRGNIWNNHPRINLLSRWGIRKERARAFFIEQQQKRDDEQSARREKLVRFYLEEFKNQLRIVFQHASFLKGFRYRTLILEHLKTGYAETNLYGIYNQWEALEKSVKEDNQKLRDKLRANLETLGRKYNVPQDVQGIMGGSRFYYYADSTINTILEKSGLPDWKGFTKRNLDDSYYIESETGTGTVAILVEENKPDDYLNDLNSLVSAVADQAKKLRKDISESVKLDTAFQEGFQKVLNEAELGSLKGNCSNC